MDEDAKKLTCIEIVSYVKKKKNISNPQSNRVLAVPWEWRVGEHVTCERARQTSRGTVLEFIGVWTCSLPVCHRQAISNWDAKRWTCACKLNVFTNASSTVNRYFVFGAPIRKVWEKGIIVVMGMCDEYKKLVISYPLFFERDAQGVFQITVF